MENQVFRKKRIITFGYIFLFGTIVLIIYLINSPDPTCFDKKRNQNESGIDCGGPCSPCEKIVETKNLEVQEVAFTFGGNNTFDVVAKIYNPNGSAGAREFKYTFTLKDSSGNVISTSEGKSFVLPGDSRYIVRLGLQTKDNAVAASSQIQIDDVQWEKFFGMGKPQIGVYNKKFGNTLIGIGNEAGGMIRNESNYDLREIDIAIVLRDERGKVVGLSTTKKNNIRIREEQDFFVSWPYSIDSYVQKMDVDPQSNIFDPQNFTISQ